MKKENVEVKSKTTLTDAEIVSLYISAVSTFAEVGSRADLTKGQVFDYGKRLFDEAIESISTTRKRLSDVSGPDGEK